MTDRKFRVTDITAAAAFAIVLGISSIWGIKEQGSAAAVKESGTVLAESGIDGEEAEAGWGSPRINQGSAGNGPVLNQKQDALAGDIMKALSQGNLEEAAKIITREEETLQDMFYTTMEGQRYLYDGESLREEIEGQGMVFTMPGKVYYGTFKDGKPEGQCTAFQVVNLDAPRYDYSEGMWKEGKMDGSGHTGYCYYEWSPEGEVRDICKSGTFSEDFMDGEVIYTSVNEKDQTVTWKLTVDQGVVVLDHRWVYVESTGEYQLLSEDSDNHAYALGQEKMKLPVWKNLLIWDD